MVDPPETGLSGGLRFLRHHRQKQTFDPGQTNYNQTTNSVMFVAKVRGTEQTHKLNRSCLQFRHFGGLFFLHFAAHLLVFISK